MIRLEDTDGRNFELLSGINGSDNLLELHFEAAFKKESVPTSADVKKWFSQIAEYIVDERPFVSAVVAKSWMMSHPIMQRLGFSVHKAKRNGPSSEYWGQMIDEHGEIDPDKADYYIKTGELPYPVSVGSIHVSDFLKMYLPENRFGEITLKKLDVEKEEQRKSIKKDAEFLKSRLADLVKGEITIEKLFEMVPALEVHMCDLGVFDDVKKYLNALIQSKNIFSAENAPAEFKEMMREIEPSFKRFDDSVTNPFYVEYKILINQRLTQTEMLRRNKIKESREKFEKFGTLSMTEEDYKNIGIEPDPRLIENPGKALWEIMSDEEILKMLDESNSVSNNPDSSDKVAMESLFIHLKTRMFLQSVGRLPAKYGGK